MQMAESATCVCVCIVTGVLFGPPNVIFSGCKEPTKWDREIER